MTMDDIYRIITEVVLFLIASYFIFYRKFVGELGKQTAELIVIKEKTRDIEEVKKEFNESLENLKKDLQLQLAKDIEPFKAALSRKNIEYQIYSSEFIKLRFLRLDELYSKLYELQKWIRTNMFFYVDEKDFQNKRNEFHRQYQITEDIFYKASLYINEDIQVKVIDLLNKGFSSMQAFTMAYNSDPKKFEFMFKLQRQDLIQSMLERNQNSIERLYNSIDEFPILLRNIETEFKKHLKMPEENYYYE